VIFCLFCWIPFGIILLRIFASMFIKELSLLDVSLSCFGMSVILAS
jgi:hypothetical protein